MGVFCVAQARSGDVTDKRLDEILVEKLAEIKERDKAIDPKHHLRYIQTEEKLRAKFGNDTFHLYQYFVLLGN